MANRSTTLIHYWYSYFVTIKLTKTLGFADLENYWLDTVENCLQKVMCDIGSKYPICITSDITDAPCLKFNTINTLFINRWHHFKFVNLLHKMLFP